MALADLMKRGFLTSATATVATPATHRGANHLTVATVAGVAVAKVEKSKPAIPSVATVAGVAVAKPQNSKTASVAESLALFGLESVQQEIDAGYPADELHRLHNMTWELMQSDDMGFDEAIRKAAAIVVSTQVAVCEASYADVMALFTKLRQSQPAPDENSPSDFDWLPANDDEIGADDVRVSRITLFMERGVTGGESRALADRLTARDLTGYDDRRVCLECVHLSGTVTSRRCAQWRKHGGTSAAIPADLADMLQRCAGFDPVRHDGGVNHA
ncbi:MAG: hypothetical protein H7315_13305 [Herminiimonas sp.]|nr:hypothetical protein [Herminiimonas sp.]